MLETIHALEDIGEIKIFCCIGNNNLRGELLETVMNIPLFIHPSVVIKMGTIVEPKVIVNVYAVSRYWIKWLNSYRRRKRVLVMSNDKRKIKKIIGITTAVTGGVFIILKIIGNIKKGNSVYKNEPGQQNIMVGKKVMFVQNDNDPENADGVRGHLEANKRAFDVVLSFAGLVVLFPIYAVIALAIVIDDPGPVLFTQKRIGQNKEYFKLHNLRAA